MFRTHHHFSLNSQAESLLSSKAQMCDRMIQEWQSRSLCQCTKDGNIFVRVTPPLMELGIMELSKPEKWEGFIKDARIIRGLLDFDQQHPEACPNTLQSSICRVLMQGKIIFYF